MDWHSFIAHIMYYILQEIFSLVFIIASEMLPRGIRKIDQDNTVSICDKDEMRLKCVSVWR